MLLPAVKTKHQLLYIARTLLACKQRIITCTYIAAGQSLTETVVYESQMLISILIFGGGGAGHRFRIELL